MIFGTLNPEKISHKNSYTFVHHSTSPVRCSQLRWEIQKSHFTSIIHTYFWSFTLSQTKTNCNPLPQATWKVTCTLKLVKCKTISSDWRFVAFFSNVGGSGESQLLSLVALKRASCNVWQLECQQAMSLQCLEWPPSALIHASSLFRHWSVAYK